MTFLQTLWNLVAVLPDLFKLLRVLQERINAAELDRKVSDDVKTIHEAFNAKDPEKLRALFASH